MSDKTPDSSPASLPASPYVGMRPFEKGEKVIFYGRDRDAALLTDKVFSSRLTVLFGPSGVGKSSILRTLLVPNLVQQDARAIYFDEWHGENPADVLKAQLVAEATALQITDPGAGAPSLADLVRLIINVDDRTLVLILDQFEEFFTKEDRPLAPLRQELAALVRNPDMDVRILLSLREEHLASLEPFRTEIFTLFQSTYRLEPLKIDSTREAIEKPAELFGVTYQPELVDKLVTDLTQVQQAGKPVKLSVEKDGSADLPILQLVCEQLWKEAAKSQEKSIPLSLYQKLGERKGILAKFLLGVMPRRWSKKYFTAKLMKHLAPSDGFKVSLSGTYLRERFFRIFRKSVQAELERLSRPEVRVLRTRNFAEGQVRYELWHDRFIGIIAPWRDRQLRRFKIQQGLGIFISAIILITTGVGFKDRYDLRKNTSQIMKKDDMTAQQKFDHVASYLLWSRKGPERLERLKGLLVEHADELPLTYGVERGGYDFLTLVPEQQYWPINVRYSSRRLLDERSFALTWQGLAKFLIEDWRIPVPLRLKLIPDGSLPTDQIHWEGDLIEPLTLKEVPLQEQNAYFDTSLLQGQGREFYEAFKEEWTPIPSIQIETSSYSVVPRWSLPAWKSAGITAGDGSGLPAFMLAIELLDKPEHLITPDAVNILLNQVAVQFPETVAEARAIRGARLVQDFQEIVKRKYALKGLPVILDILTTHPEGSAEEIAAEVDEDIEALYAFLPWSLRGPHGEDSRNLDDFFFSELDEIPEAYRDSLKWLPEPEPEIRVYIGPELWSTLITAENTYIPELRQQLDTVWKGLARKYGVLMPVPKFRHSYWDATPNFPPAAFRIELLSQSKDHWIAQPVEVDEKTGLSKLIAALQFRAESYRIHFLNSDYVAKLLDDMDPELRGWLTEKYSLTDLKLLLRGLVNPGYSEQEERFAAFDAGLVGQVFENPAENSIRYPHWLLASLVFWTQRDDRLSVDVMVEDLRQTQRSRLALAASDPENASILNLVQQGLTELAGGELQVAEKLFAKAIKQDVEQATEVFLALYPQKLEASLRARYADRCRFGDPYLSRSEWVDLEDLVAGLKSPQGQGPDFNPETSRRLELCLLAGYPDYYPEQRHALEIELTENYGPPDQWRPDDAEWFGRQLLTDYDPLSGDRMLLEKGLAFLKSGLTRLDDDVAALLSYRDYINVICNRVGPVNWCREQLLNVAKARPTLDIKVDAAWFLSDREKMIDSQQALELVAQLKNELQSPQVLPQTREELGDWVDLVRAKALLNLSRFQPDEQTMKEAEAILLRLQSSPTVQSFPYRELADLRMRQNRLDEADKILDEASEKWPDVNIDTNYGTKLQIALLRGDRQAVADSALASLGMVIKGWQEEITTETQEFAFMAALGLLVTGTEPWERTARDFIKTDHSYVPYIAMLLSTRMTGKSRDEAKEVLAKRWAKATPENWTLRLQHGDETAWREMLIGHYMGEVDDEAMQQIFSELETEENYARSNLRFLPLPRLGMLCEAYLYDALHAEAEGQIEAMRASLGKAVATGWTSYFEYCIATYLLSQQ
ncbi:MAG TPA: ATP-binding protein [Malonomonas sp.]